jgi:hypothetical protein
LGALFVAAPLAPIAAAIALALIVALTEGHWPSYGNPDPKDLPPAYQPVYLAVLAFTAISFVLLPIFATGSISILLFAARGGADDPVPWLVATVLAWLSLLSWVLLDPLGLLDWLAD